MNRNKILVALNQSELSHKILPSVEQLFPAGENELILYFVTKPPRAAGFGEPDLSAGFAAQHCENSGARRGDRQPKLNRIVFPLIVMPVDLDRHR